MADLPHVRPEKPAEPAPGTVPALTAVDVVAFLVALFAVGTLAFWGFVSWPFPWNIVAGIGAPVLAVGVWALFVSPRAMIPVHPFVRAFVELLVYAAATAAWWDLGNAWVGLAFAVVAVAVGLVTGRRRLTAS